MTLHDLTGSLRVRQWTKNVVVFAALIFAGRATDSGFLVRSAAAFFLFSLVSGAVYVFNDILDIAHDSLHPLKRSRPIASGRIPLPAAWTLFIVTAGAALIGAFLLDTGFGAVATAYFTLQAFYSMYLKNIIILDVFIISIGFVLRVVAGAVVLNVDISSWILVCTMLLALFLALSKRRHEITLLESGASDHRVILAEYSPYLLDQMIGVVTSATLVAYMIFTLSDETVAKFGKYLILTVPFVLYGIFRYLYLVHNKNAGGQPEEVLLTDIPLQIAIAGYGLTAIAVIYFS